MMMINLSNLSPPGLPKCRTRADIGFILDSSGSLRHEYHKEKEFLKNIAKVFGVSEFGSRASVITFSYFAEHRYVECDWLVCWLITDLLID